MITKYKLITKDDSNFSFEEVYNQKRLYHIPKSYNKIYQILYYEVRDGEVDSQIGSMIPER